MEKNLNFQPHTAVITIKVGIYEKLPNGMLSPSAKEFKEGYLAMEGNNLDDCMDNLNRWFIQNRILQK
jgi:hypothetical protein